MTDIRSRIPSIDSLLASEAVAPLLSVFGRDRVVVALRSAVADVRGAIERVARDGDAPVLDAATYATKARALLLRDDVPSLRRVVNATGVVLHTNLGRAPLATSALDAMHAAAGGYSNLEFDLEEGGRGSRYVHCVSLLTELTGAEDALVVNNAAAALVLMLNTLGRGEGVAVSRGELVEIGGGFRIPDVLERSGARMVEVGSTNRTRLADYEAAVTEGDARAILKVHRSNFRITGFTEEVSVEDLAALARRHGVPLLHDLGSGLMVDAQRLDLPPEPRASDSLQAGVDVVAVSGDKLLGGTQAGILVGGADWIGRMRRNPLCRALRVDKVTLAGLEATLRLYRDPQRALQEIPALRMLAADPTDIERSARGLAATLARALHATGVGVDVVQSSGAVGGGTFPGTALSSWAVRLTPRGGRGSGADALSTALRRGAPPVVGRIVDSAVLLDLRTVLPGETAVLARRVIEAATAVDGTGTPEARS